MWRLKQGNSGFINVGCGRLWQRSPYRSGLVTAEITLPEWGLTCRGIKGRFKGFAVVQVGVYVLSTTLAAGVWRGQLVVAGRQGPPQYFLLSTNLLQIYGLLADKRN